tara:strand:+ start:1035 stop:2489 length:1455 start_codon:yes stop_codon:yes gene_type:complete
MMLGDSPFDINSNPLKPKHFNAMMTRAVTCGEGQRQRWNYATQQNECVRDDGFRFNTLEDVETWVGYFRQNIINRESGVQDDLTSARTTYGDALPDDLQDDDDRVLFQRQTTLMHQVSDDRRWGDVTGQTQEQREYALSREGIGEVTTRWWDAIGEATWRRNTFGDDPYDNQMFNDSPISSTQPIALNIGEMDNSPAIPEPTLWERYTQIQQRVFREQRDTAPSNEEGELQFTYTQDEQSVIDEQTELEDSYSDRVRAWYSANYSGGLDEDGEVITNTGYWDDDDNYVEGESTWISDGEEPVFMGIGAAPEGRTTVVTNWEFDVPAVETVWCAVGDCDNPDSNSRRQLCWMGYDEYCDGDDSELMPVVTSVAQDTSSTPQNTDDSQNLTPVDTGVSQTSDGATQEGLYGRGGTSGTGGNYHGCSGVNERYDSQTQDCQCNAGFSRDPNTGECVSGTPMKPMMILPSHKPKGFWAKVWDGLNGGV